MQTPINLLFSSESLQGCKQRTYALVYRFVDGKLVRCDQCNFAVVSYSPGTATVRMVRSVQSKLTVRNIRSPYSSASRHFTSLTVPRSFSSI